MQIIGNVVVRFVRLSRTAKIEDTGHCRRHLSKIYYTPIPDTWYICVTNHERGAERGNNFGELGGI